MSDENHKLVEVLSNRDVLQREQELKCFSKAQKSIFCTNLASEIIAQKIPTDTHVQGSFIDHCYVKISSSIIVAEYTERISLSKKWLKKKLILYHDAIISEETYSAFIILSYKHATDDQFEIAADFLRNIVELVDAQLINYDAEDRFFNNLMELRYFFTVLNEIKAKELCKLFTAIGEKLVQKSDCNQHRLSIVIDVLITCADYKNFIESTFPFWENFSKFIKDEQKIYYRNYVEQFLVKLTKSCIFTNINSAMMETECFGSELVTLRANAANLIQKLISFIDTQQTFEFYFLKMKENEMSLEDTEVCLFLISCIANHIDYAENNLVPQLIDQILQLDEHSNASIVYMSIKVLKEISHWVNAHNQTHLTSVLNFLLKFLNIQGAFASVAADTLSEICSAARIPMQTHIHHLFEIIKEIENYSMHIEAEVKLIKEVSRVVYSLPNDHLIYEAMKDLCEIQLAKISKYYENDAYKYVDQLAEIFHNIPPVISNNSPATQVFIENWHVICYMLNHYQNDGAVMKKIVECIRCAVYNLKYSINPILEDIVKQLLFFYCVKKYHFILRCMNVIVETLGSNERLLQGLFISFQGFSVATFSGLHDESELNAEIIDEFFQLSTSCVNKMPMQLFKSPLVLKIIDLAISSCKINKKNVNKSAMKFILSVITCSCFHHDIETCVLNALTIYSSQIVSTLIQSSALIFDASLFPDVVDIFCAIKIRSNVGFKELLIQAIQTLPSRNLNRRPMISIDRINQIVNSLTRSKISKMEMNSEITNLKNLFRGNCLLLV